jgi:colanic acid biosynthesis glycosyl transferase WcaI
LKIQLWSYNYDPEPTGIGVVSTVWARGLLELGHEVEVVAAHPHYPDPRWGVRLRPYREVRDRVRVLRLPLWIGRGSTTERFRQELTFMAAQAAATPFLRRPDVLVSTSPCFPALLPAIANVRTRNIPWVLWLHDLLPDGATATGLVKDGGFVLALARRLERAAYRAADRIVVDSGSFVENLLAKRVAPAKVEVVCLPATRVPASATPAQANGHLRILSMGNIGHTQGLAAFVRAFEAHPELTGGTELVITGTGVAAEETRAEAVGEQVRMLGVVDDDELERELSAADIGFVSQRYEGSEFNVPSKIMNFMAYGLPVLAAVDPSGEAARIVREAQAGWIVDSSDPSAFPREIARIARDGAQVRERAANARRYADQHFTQRGFAARFEEILLSVVRA